MGETAPLPSGLSCLNVTPVTEAAALGQESRMPELKRQGVEGRASRKPREVGREAEEPRPLFCVGGDRASSSFSSCSYLRLDTESILANPRRMINQGYRRKFHSANCFLSLTRCQVF